MSASEKLKALIEAARLPDHGEDTWEQKQAWDRRNEAANKLDRLLQSDRALPQIVAVVEAAEDISGVQFSPSPLRMALAALDEALS